ncbi:MAG: Rieske (2Fe-2S) protein [Pseudomonadota bacterium]
MTGPTNPIPAPTGWYVVAKENEVSAKKPMRCWIHDIPLVLYRTDGEIRAFVDRCPHRGAKLSDGKIRDGKIECPYHGWRFGPDGALAEMPCLVGTLPRISATKLETAVARGLVFVAVGQPAEPPYTNDEFDEIQFWRPIRGEVKADIADALENFLDPTHTIFVHRQLVRSVTNSNRTRVEITAQDQHVLARYLGEGQAGGVVAALMNEKDRALSVGRFVGPNVAEVEFHGPSSVNFVMTGYMTPTRDGLVSGFGLVGLPGPKWWARLKFWLLYPWIKLVHAQDQKILQRTRSNNEAFQDKRQIVGPLDVLRNYIDAIRAGKNYPAATEPRIVEMNL